MEGKVLRFLKSLPPYNPGETAGFRTPEADRILLMNGVAMVDPTIKFREPTRSPGLDPPQFSLQHFATAMADATRLAQETAGKPAKV